MRQKGRAGQYDVMMASCARKKDAVRGLTTTTTTTDGDLTVAVLIKT